MNWERNGGKHSQHLIGGPEKIMKTPCQNWLVRTQMPLHLFYVNILQTSLWFCWHLKLMMFWWVCLFCCIIEFELWPYAFVWFPKDLHFPLQWISSHATGSLHCAVTLGSETGLPDVTAVLTNKYCHVSGVCMTNKRGFGFDRIYWTFIQLVTTVHKSLSDTL
jgi:hypothetical protein